MLAAENALSQLPVSLTNLDYSPEGIVYMNSQSADDLWGDLYNVYTEGIDKNQDRITLRRWSIGKLNVALYPETRIYKLLPKKLAN